MFGTPRTPYVLYLLLVVTTFVALLLAENVAASLWGHFPVVAALVMSFALLICADDFGHGRYFDATGDMVLAVVAAALIRDVRRRKARS